MSRMVVTRVSLGILLCIGGCHTDPHSFHEVNGVEERSRAASSYMDGTEGEIDTGLVYEFVWEALPADWESKKTVVNDVGYTITFTDAWLGVYRIQLAPCP